MKLMTLDTSGYVSDPPSIIDRVFQNFFVANYSQTNLHYGKIYSLPWLIARHAEDPIGLEVGIRSALLTMFAMFDRVECDVSVDYSDEKPDSEYEIKVDLVVYIGINQYSAGRLLSMVKNKISNIETI